MKIKKREIGFNYTIASVFEIVKLSNDRLNFRYFNKTQNLYRIALKPEFSKDRKLVIVNGGRPVKSIYNTEVYFSRFPHVGVDPFLTIAIPGRRGDAVIRFF